MIPSQPLVLALTGALVALPAQAPAPHGPELLEVTRAAAGETVGVPRTTQHGLAGMRDGSVHAAILRSRANGTETDLELWCCAAGTRQWQQIGAAPTLGDDVGAIVVDGDLLAVAWSARGTGTWYSVYAQRFDPAKRTWIGEPALLAKGTGEEDQYAVPDLERVRSGALVCVFGTHRSPVGAWTSGWSTGMCWLAPGARAWTDPVQVNTHMYGCAGTLAALGDSIDIVFRTNPDTARLGLRTFDAVRGAFTADKDLLATEPTPDGEWIANTPAMAIDALGGCTILLQVGALDALGSSPNERGRLVLAYAPPGGGAGRQFTSTLLCEDPTLHGGNENPHHFALVRGPANQLHAYFAKAGDDFASLWHCAIVEGKPVGAPRRIGEGQPHAFATICGMRCAQSFSTVHAIVAGYPTDAAGGIVRAVGRWPARTVFDAR